MCADVAESAVVGLPDNEYGQVVAAIIVPQVCILSCTCIFTPLVTGYRCVCVCVCVRVFCPQQAAHQLDTTAIQTFLRGRLAPYKVPRRFLLLGSIPRNAMGKVNKKELVKLFPPTPSPPPANPPI